MCILRQLQKCWEVQKLLQPDFSPIVKNICYGINSNRTRAEAEEELMGHLEDTYERNIAIGKSEDEAFNASVASLGNTKILAQQLQAVHAHSPAAQMKSAIWIFIIGFILQKFHLNLFTGMSLITNFIGMICWLVSLYLLHKANKNLRIAYYLYALLFLLSVVENCVVGYGIKNDIFNYTYICVYYVLCAIMCICAIYGFIQMDNIYCNNSEKRKPHLGFALVYMPLEIAVAGVISVMNYGENLNFENGILFIILVFIYIFILVQFVRLKNRLWDADARYGIDSFNKKNIPAVCTVIALSIIVPCCFMYAYAVKDTEKTELVIHDTQMQIEADAVREQMLELGVDADTLNMLPDSEIMNYKDAVTMTFSARGVNDGYEECRIFNFYFCDKSGNKYIRTLFVTYIKDCNYRCGFYYYSNTDEYYNHFEPLNDSIYISIVQEQGSKYYTKPPINSNFPNLCNPNLIQGFDFKAEENQTVIFALSQSLRNYYEEEDYISMQRGLIFVNQRFPLTFMYNTVEDFAAATTQNNAIIFSRVENPFMESCLFWDGTYIEPKMTDETI